MSVFSLAVLIIAIALVFDYINGFHDAANSIATIVATRVLTPFQAVVWAAFFNFAAAFIFGTAVAKTVGKGFVDLDLVTPYVFMGGLIGALIWYLHTLGVDVAIRVAAHLGLHQQSSLRNPHLGAAGRLRGNCAGHFERRMAHCAHHGRKADAPQTAQRVPRGNGRGRRRAPGDPPGASRLHHPR